MAVGDGLGFPPAPQSSEFGFCFEHPVNITEPVISRVIARVFFTGNGFFLFTSHRGFTVP